MHERTEVDDRHRSWQTQAVSERRVFRHFEKIDFNFHLRPQTGKISEDQARGVHFGGLIAQVYDAFDRIHANAADLERLLHGREDFLRILDRHTLRYWDGDRHGRSHFRAFLGRVANHQRETLVDRHQE